MKLKLITAVIVLSGAILFASFPTTPVQAQGSCNNVTGAGSFFGLPPWYKYLDCDANGAPQLDTSEDGINRLWLIGAAVIEIMTRLAGLLAVIFVMYGGFRYLTSGGNPDQTAGARKTIIYALAGLALSIIATSTVSYIAGSIATGSTPGTANASSIQASLRIVYSIAAAISALMVVIGGLRFVTANGDPGKVASARNTVIYSLVGLVVVLFASIITSFVVNFD